MKNFTFILCSLVFILCSFNLKAQDQIEQSIEKRDVLLSQYDSINTQIKDSNNFEIKNLALIQSKLIKKDIFIIDELLNIKDLYNEILPANQKLINQLAENETELTEKRQWVEWGMYGGGGLIILFLLVLILFIIKAVKASKLKGEIRKMEVLHKQYQEKLEASKKSEENISKLPEIEANYNQIIAENKIDFEKEKNRITEKLSEVQQNAELLQNNVITLQQEKRDLLTQIENTNTDSETDKNNKIQNLEAIINSKEIEIQQLKETSTLSQNKADANERLNEKAEIESLIKKIQKLENEIRIKEGAIADMHNRRSTESADELSNLKQLLEDEKTTNQQLKRNIDDLNNDISILKNDFINSNVVIKRDEIIENVIEHKAADFAYDTQVIINENNTLKLENEEYKKIIKEELEFRKDILKLIKDLNK